MNGLYIWEHFNYFFVSRKNCCEKKAVRLQKLKVTFDVFVVEKVRIVYFWIVTLKLVICVGYVIETHDVILSWACNSVAGTH